MLGYVRSDVANFVRLDLVKDSRINALLIKVRD